MGVLYEVVIAPVLAKFGISPRDPTFGRYRLPPSQAEVEFEAQTHVTTRSRRVFFTNSNVSSIKIKGYPKSTIEAPEVGNASQYNYIEVQEGEDVSLTSKELVRGRGRQWIFYKIYENNTPDARKGKGYGCDILFSHGEHATP